VGTTQIPRSAYNGHSSGPARAAFLINHGRTSWTAVLDAVRLGPDDDQTAVTAAQVREVGTRLIEAGH
jgi:hypothetical protein